MSSDSLRRSFALRGFSVLRNFFGGAEATLLRADFSDAAELAARLSGGNQLGTTYGVRHVGQAALAALTPKLLELGELLGLKADLLVAAFYWDTLAANFSIYHQDLDPYWLFQDPLQYINVYVPFIKPISTKSNIELFSCDSIEEKLVGVVGAARGPHELVLKETTTVRDLSTGDSAQHYIDLRGSTMCPHLAEGDALVLRGDTLHRTQDVETRRVAASFRLASSRQILSRELFLTGGLPKLNAVLTNKRLTKALSAFFREREDYLPASRVFRAIVDESEPDECALRELRRRIAQLTRS
jgi:hypothetical protein